MTLQNKTLTAFWSQDDSYKSKWKERSSSLWKMFQKCELASDRKYTISEFGCGKLAPFSECVESESNITIQKYDIEKWDDDTIVCDLNRKEFSVAGADIAVFSGVLEYLDDAEGTLNKILTNDQYILLSYAFVPIRDCTKDSNFINSISKRSAKRGWRNHFTNPQLVEILQRIGTITDAGTWNGNQSLFQIRSHTQDSD